jgi:hypothetical protein
MKDGSNLPQRLSDEVTLAEQNLIGVKRRYRCPWSRQATEQRVPRPTATGGYATAISEAVRGRQRPFTAKVLQAPFGCRAALNGLDDWGCESCGVPRRRAANPALHEHERCIVRTRLVSRAGGESRIGDDGRMLANAGPDTAGVDRKKQGGELIVS